MRVAFVILTLLVPGCASAPDIAPETTFALRIGDSARVGACGLTVELLGVRNDSRCPTGTTCVWAGDAEIEMKIRSTEGTRSLVRRLFGPALTAPCSINVIGLAPPVQPGETIQPSQYVVSLSVTQP